MSLLYPFFLWSDTTRVGVAIRQSRVLFPIIETVHLLGLAAFLGIIVVLSLRLMELTLQRQAIPDLARELAPWSTGSLTVVLASGCLLFTSEALRCYGSRAFHVKMAVLATALVFHVTAFRRATRPSQPSTPVWRRMTGICALVLWFGVGLAGRGIAFLE